MNYLNEKVYKTLEFDKILNIASRYAVLDKTKTAVLKCEPETDLIKAENALSHTDSAMKSTVMHGSAPIYNFGEFDSVEKRLEVSGTLSQNELLRTALLFKSARLMKSYISDSPESTLFSYTEALFSEKQIEDEISSKIISDEEIHDSASRELFAIRRKKESTHGKIRETLQKYTSSQTYKKYLQSSNVALRNDRFVLPVKQEYRNEIQGLIHDSSDSGATVFIEPMTIVKLNNSLKELEGEEKAEIERILAELSGKAAGLTDEIKSNRTILETLDLIFAKAKYSLFIKGEIPAMNDRGIINLKKARHPLLNPETAVPVDISLGRDFDTLVITGPNTGGKTVSLKTLGLFSLMAMSGFAIPAFFGSEVSVFHEIYADIGDEQSIEQSLSTFSSHMKNISKILNGDLYESLALFDELGAGTDPTEGAALAISIIEYLRKRGVRVAATTHYPELKLYALSHDGVRNASLEFSVETLMPTYRLIMGMPGRSNAFAISEKLGIPEEIIKNAQGAISEDALKFEEVLSAIDENRVIAEKEKEEASALREQVAQLQKELKEKKDDAYKKNREIIEKARQEAVFITEEAQKRAEEIIDTLNKTAKDQRQRAKAVGDARRMLGEEKKKQSEKLVSETKKKHKTLSPSDIKVGLTVMFEDIDAPVSIESLPDKNGNLTVLAGIMKVKTNLSKLYAVKEENKEPKKKKITVSTGVNIKNKQIRPEIDLRGMNLEEAEYVTEKFIDDAVLGGIPSITIIHGKGTGILRAGIHQLLKKNKAIKSFRLGTFGEGEAGVTVAELK